jgi:hypothetical protein
MFEQCRLDERFSEQALFEAYQWRAMLRALAVAAA